MDGGPKRKEIVSGASLTYRSKNWGLEAIVREPLSNHMDEKESFDYFLHNGERINVADYAEQTPIDYVMGDAGDGYTYNRLVRFHSDKDDDKGKIGHFGEGLKLASATALRENVSVEFYSRDWKATAKIFEEEGDRGMEQYLAFDVEEGGEAITGSKTIIRNVSPEMLTAIFSFRNKVFSLGAGTGLRKCTGYHPVHEVYTHAEESGKLFVHGIQFSTSKPLLYSYNILTHDILHPDRTNIDELKLRRILGEIVCSYEKEADIRNMISPGINDFLHSPLAHPQRWKTVFHSKVAYGPNAVLSSNHAGYDSAANAHGYTVVKGITPKVREILRYSGVQFAKDVIDKGPQIYGAVPISELSEAERKKLDSFLEIRALLSGGDPLPYEMFVFDRAESHLGKDDPYFGLTDFSGKKEYLLRSLLADGQEEQLMDTLLHEYGHVESGATDETLKFEQALSKNQGKIGLMLLRKIQKRRQAKATIKMGMDMLDDD